MPDAIRTLSETALDSCANEPVDGWLRLLEWRGALQFPIKHLQYKEGFFLLPVIGKEILAIKIIFHTRDRSARAAEVFKNPRGHSSKKGNALQHDELMLVEVFLILLG